MAASGKYAKRTLSTKGPSVARSGKITPNRAIKATNTTTGNITANPRMRGK
jgi:hypothetical protein